MSSNERWERAGRPLPISAVRVPGGDCSYETCDRSADYLVKVENIDGVGKQHRSFDDFFSA